MPDSGVKGGRLHCGAASETHRGGQGDQALIQAGWTWVSLARHLAFLAGPSCCSWRIRCSCLILAPLVTECQGGCQGVVTPEFQGGTEGGGRADSALYLHIMDQNIWVDPGKSSSLIPKKRTGSALSAPSHRGRKRGFLSTEAPSGAEGEGWMSKPPLGAGEGGATPRPPS